MHLNMDLKLQLEMPIQTKSTQFGANFKFIFGKEGSSSASDTQKRNVTENIKYFIRLFRVDNYKSH